MSVPVSPRSQPRSAIGDPLYRRAPRELVRELDDFRQRAPTQSREIDGRVWQYRIAGSGTISVVILGGAGATADGAFRLMTALGSEYRFLAITYPNCETISALVEGIMTVAAAESMPRFHVVATSFGTAVAHVMLRRFPDRVDRVVLSACGLYSERILQATHTVFRVFRQLPYSWICAYKRLVVAAIVRDAPPDDRAFHQALFRDIVERQGSKPALMSQHALLTDLWRHADTYRLHEISERSNVLLLQAADDTAFNPVERSALLALYPKGTSHVFAEGGHARDIVRFAEYRTYVTAFLANGRLPA